MSGPDPSSVIPSVRIFANIQEIAAASGQEVGKSPWLEITQERLDRFADTTGDQQWIHVDPDRAKKGPYGSTIAHGYLILSLLPMLASQAYTFGARLTRVNYGVNRARFPHPVRVGSRVRAVVTFGNLTSGPAGSLLLQGFVVEVEGAHKPACVAETVVLLVE